MRDRRLALLAFVPVLLVATACSSGSDGDDSASSSTSSSSTSSTPSTAPTTTIQPVDQIDGEASAYCADWLALRSVAAPKLTGDQAKDDEARKKHYSALVPKVEKLVADADDDIVAQARTALKIVKQAAADGKFSHFETAESQRAQAELEGYAEGHCAKG